LNFELGVSKRQHPVSPFQSECKISGSVAGDFQRPFEFFRELLDFVEDFLGLLGEVIDQARHHIGLAANEFERGDHQGEVIIYVMAQVRKFAIQIGDLFRAEGNSLTGQAHIVATMGRLAVESKLVRGLPRGPDAP